MRPDFDTYFSDICQVVATRGECVRATHGAVIVKENRIVSTGYNGAAAGQPNCLQGHCPRAHSGVPNHNDGNHNYSDCISLHAEQNAIAYANRADTQGATIYVTGNPCDMCMKLIAAAGIVRCVVIDPLR